MPTNFIPCIPSHPHERSALHANILPSEFSDSFVLTDILRDFGLESLHLQTKIQQTEGNILVDPTYTCDYFDPILHRLLSLPRQDLSSSNASIAEMIRLGAILYLIAVRQSFGIYPIRVKIQIRKLSVLLISFEDSEMLLVANGFVQ